MKKHFSLHLHSGHKMLVKEINTCSNSAALLSMWPTPGEVWAGGVFLPSTLARLVWTLRVKEKMAAGSLPTETFELGDLQVPLPAQWSSNLGMHQPPDGLLKHTLLPQCLTEGSGAGLENLHF